MIGRPLFATVCHSVCLHLWWEVVQLVKQSIICKVVHMSRWLCSACPHNSVSCFFHFVQCIRLHLSTHPVPGIAFHETLKIFFLLQQKDSSSEESESSGDEKQEVTSNFKEESKVTNDLYQATRKPSRHKTANKRWVKCGKQLLLLSILLFFCSEYLGIWSLVCDILFRRFIYCLSPG